MENLEEMNQNIETLQMSLNSMSHNVAFVREELTKLDKTQKLSINFNDCHVAVSRNGGLMAVCKKRGFLDITKGSLLNNFVIIMHQNAQVRYQIPFEAFTADYRKSFFVCFDFNEDEQLYGICNDGNIYKFSTLTCSASRKLRSQIFEGDNIDRAVLFQKGYVALTCSGIFYYVPNIKDSKPEELFPMGHLLKFRNDIPFVVLPASKSKSRKIELIFTNDEGDGVVDVAMKEEGNFGVVPSADGKNLVIKDVSKLVADKLEDYTMTAGANPNENKAGSMGKIDAIAVSPSYSQIAFYNKSTQTVYLFSAKLDENLGRYPRVQAQFKVDESFSQHDVAEQKSVLIDFAPGTQFLFCGEDAVAIIGKRFIFVVNSCNHTLVYKITEHGEIDAMNGMVFCKGVSEVDGLRFVTNDAVAMVRRVPNEVIDVVSLYSSSAAKKLLAAFESAVRRQEACADKVRAIGDALPRAITVLQLAAAHLFWTKADKEPLNKDLQLFFLKASQYGKNFVHKEDFNFDKFVETCKDLRIINNLRNSPDKPRFVTYGEYKSMTCKQLVKRVLRMHHFQMAHEICEYVGYPLKKVYKKYAFSCIKKLESKLPSREQSAYEKLMEIIRPIDNVSYTKLAKKAFKYEHKTLGNLFLNQEKSLLTKIPEYVKQNNFDSAIIDSLETLDSNVLVNILERAFKNMKNEDFVKLVVRHPKITAATIDFLKKNDREDVLGKYLVAQKNYEEIFFITLEKFFKVKSAQEREVFLKLAKTYLKHLESNKEFDHKFYKGYVDSLEKALKFNAEVVKSDIMKEQNLSSAFASSQGKEDLAQVLEVSPFKFSIVDWMKFGIKNERFPFMKKLSEGFEFTPKKLTLLRMKCYAEMKKGAAIENLLKEPVKKLGISYINAAEILYEIADYKRAADALKLEKESEHADYKLELLNSMEKYEDALEHIISDKKNDNKAYQVNFILNKKPQLQRKVEELCHKYKVNLNK